MTLLSTSAPMECEFHGDGRSSRPTLMRLPGAGVPLPREGVDGPLATRLPTRTGTGALLASYLAGLRATAAECTGPELRRLSATALDLAHTFLAARVDGPADLPTETRQRVLPARVDSFIDSHLTDPDLGPAVIATSHNISVRLLHTLFERHPETVGATIRRRRLERARADLTDPRLRRSTIAEIALRSGFRHPADFSRTFRRAYGTTPGDFRRTSKPPAPLPARPSRHPLRPRRPRPGSRDRGSCPPRLRGRSWPGLESSWAGADVERAARRPPGGTQ
ncbi:AraC-like DNA-binding protein [Actinocorallia herbida]|uniref:AraC-like DNA-binding protein n=1 Tax=Actinocorallia herbida TaxID=58109 RepID=A0A3N1D170_9ACTN|nr:AraC-like DNA-binding protein [Actinocorallia herbida]